MRKDVVYKSGIGIIGSAVLECYLLNGRDIIDGKREISCSGVANAVVSSGAGNRGRDKMIRHFWWNSFLENGFLEK